MQVGCCGLTIECSAWPLADTAKKKKKMEQECMNEEFSDSHWSTLFTLILSQGQHVTSRPWVSFLRCSSNSTNRCSYCIRFSHEEAGPGGYEVTCVRELGPVVPHLTLKAGPFTPFGGVTLVILASDFKLRPAL